MPVSFSTVSGSLLMMSSTSPVILAAPTPWLPLDTMVIFFTALSGLLISSATCGRGATPLRYCRVSLKCWGLSWVIIAGPPIWAGAVLTDLLL